MAVAKRQEKKDKGKAHRNSTKEGLRTDLSEDLK